MERIAEYMDDQKKESEESPQEEEEQEEEQETAHSGNTIFGVMYDCEIGLRSRDSIDNMLNHEDVSGIDGKCGLGRGRECGGEDDGSEVENTVLI